MSIAEYPLYIGGEWFSTGDLATIELPYDGSPVAKVHQANAATVNRAIEAAQAGAKAMAELTNAERADLLLRVHGLLKRDAAEFARLLCEETGKPIKEAMGEAARAQQTALIASEEARQLRGEVIPMDAAPTAKGRMAMTVREPIGVIAAITPFNMPLNLAMHKVAPALAAGNAVVHKPSEQTPLTALRLAKVFEEAGIPRGAYNVVAGDGAAIGQQLVCDPRIAMITFTGSVPVGKSIRAAAGLKRVTLELGSNSGMVVEADADIDNAVERAVIGGFAHSGQICISVQRIYVHESIADEFLSKFTKAAQKLKMGHPLELGTDVSSLISEKAAVRVNDWIQEAVSAGARVLTGGARIGTRIPPTILENVPDEAKISCQEVFGPVVAVSRYRDLDDAIARVNNTPYGLQAGIFTTDLSKAFYAARKFRVGGVMINDIPTFRADHMPYGGVKESGLGREGPRYAIEEMTNVKLICWKL